MQRIGVLGGLGPQATMDFERRVHEVAQALLPQRANYGYPPMVVYYLRHAPVLVSEEGEPILPMQADPRLFEAARTLGACSDFLVITANAPHLFALQIAEAAGVDVLSMIDVTVQEVQRRGWRRVGLLGLGEPRVYEVPLDALGIAYSVISRAARDRLDEAILALMAGAETEDDRQAARDAVGTLRQRGVDGIVLGCTEIPLLLGEGSDAEDLVNPAALLAEAAVRRAIA